MQIRAMSWMSPGNRADQARNSVSSPSRLSVNMALCPTRSAIGTV